MAKVLLVNDDGINAPGILALYNHLIKTHDVTVVAPHMQRSASSHLISFMHAVKVEPAKHIGDKAYSCSGTPADCTKIGLILTGGVDIVVSGMNNGENLALDAHYSGTVAAAMEGVLLGCPALAVSVAGSEFVDLQGAAQLAEKVMQAIIKNHKPYNMINLNLPNLKMQEIKGFALSPMSYIRRENHYEIVSGEPGNGEYLICDKRTEVVDGSDIDILSKGYAVVTPLTWDMTDTDYLLKASSWVNDI